MRFILVDEILDLDPGRSIRAMTTLSSEEALFRDHFPGFPVVPGVLLTEMMAQAAGKCLLAEAPDRGRPILAQIKTATFRDWVRPGETVTLHAQIRTSRPQFATASATADVAGRAVCSAELMYTFLPASSFSAPIRDDVLERFLNRPLARGADPGPAL
ncbi:MAG: 3-hydroxyacyl-ACP dehydratase FabZ family protein [Verrucomicrobiales bacterium]